MAVNKLAVVASLQRATETIQNSCQTIGASCVLVQTHTLMKHERGGLGEAHLNIYIYMGGGAHFSNPRRGLYRLQLQVRLIGFAVRGSGPVSFSIQYIIT